MGEGKITQRLKLGITGGQGVGKSTFCAQLSKQLEEHGLGPVHFVPSVGDLLKRSGTPFGSEATSSSVLAIYAVHIERERLCPNDGIILMDRCAADALAYTYALALNSEVEVRLLRGLSYILAKDIDLIVHLEMTGIFDEKGLPHETPELRRLVAEQFSMVLRELERPSLSLNAASPTAFAEVEKMVRELIRN